MEVVAIACIVGAALTSQNILTAVVAAMGGYLLALSISGFTIRAMREKLEATKEQST